MKIFLPTCITATLVMLLCACGARTEPPAAATGDIVDVSGLLTEEGAECQALRADDKTLYTLTGDLQGFKTGDRVRVTGTSAELSFCQQGITLQVTGIASVSE